MQDGAEVTRLSADRAGSHGRRGSLGTRDTSVVLAIRYLDTATVCESLVARNRVLGSTDLHGFVGPWAG